MPFPPARRISRIAFEVATKCQMLSQPACHILLEMCSTSWKVSNLSSKRLSFQFQPFSLQSWLRWPGRPKPHFSDMCPLKESFWSWSFMSSSAIPWGRSNEKATGAICSYCRKRRKNSYATRLHTAESAPWKVQGDGFRLFQPAFLFYRLLLNLNLLSFLIFGHVLTSFWTYLCRIDDLFNSTKFALHDISPVE